VLLCCSYHTKHIDTLCDDNADCFLSLKLESNHWALKGSALSNLVNVTLRGDTKSLKPSCFNARLYCYRMRKFYPVFFHMFISN